MNAISSLGIFLLGATLLLSGCMSAQSTLLHRDENNIGWQRQRKLKGVPITLKVPTHIKIDVVEHHYLTSKTSGAAFVGDDDDTADDDTVTDDDTVDEESINEICWLDLGAPVRSVKTELIETEEIFTVDPKRPAAGTLNATMKFEGQYFDNIDYNVSDETIASITGLIGNVAKSGLVGAPTSSGENVDKHLKQVDSHVASAVFELASPTVEAEIQEFLLKHVSGCHSCNVVQQSP